MDSKKTQRTELSWILDDWIELPGGYRIGLDGLLGLIPGVGDVVGGFLSSLLLYHAYQAGASKGLLLTMMWNILVDTGVGSIPVFGDFFDFVWKANRKNHALLKKHLNEQEARKNNLHG